MARVLVVGVDGLIGADLARAYAGEGFEVVGTTRRGPGSDPSVLDLDLARVDAATWPLPQVDVAVFAAAMARFADCRAHPDLARRINVEAPAILAARLAAAGARSILLSTSAVFDGSRPHVPADAPTSPTSPYGAFKSEAEGAFLALGDRGGVVRLTKVLGPVHPLLSGWIDALRAGTAVEAFDDLRMAPIALADVRAGVRAASEAGGIVQVSGSRDVSYRDVLGHIADRLGSRPGLVRTASAAARGIPENDRPAHTSLDTAALSAGGWRPPDPFALLDRLYLGAGPHPPEETVP